MINISLAVFELYKIVKGTNQKTKRISKVFLKFFKSNFVKFREKLIFKLIAWIVRYFNKLYLARFRVA